KEAYVWHPYYIDALAVRFWDNNSDSDYLDTNETHFSLHDGNFNVTALIDTTGAVFERFTYSPYGKLIVLDANFALDADGASDVTNPYTYTGRRLDSESGIYYYRYRYYHGQLGRFVGRDPIEYEGGWNIYTYATCSPINFTDPEGL